MELQNVGYPTLKTKDTGSSFRFDINALRAIAILGVVFFHYKIELFNGGFIGVDVFFVISGYLMSKIIISSISKNDFSFRSYLGKRLARIVPALLFLVFVIYVIGFFIFLPEDYWQFQKNGAASVVFLSNLLYWRTSNYFAPAAENNVFLHTWSLSVEWQFYLLYPAVLLVFHKMFRRKTMYVLFFTLLTISIALVSFLWTSKDQTASFYLLPTRSWEMMMGGVAFLTEGFFGKFKFRKLLAALGYLAIFLCFFLFDNSLAWPSPYTIIPVISTLIIIVSNQNELNLVRRPIVQFIGKVSYSLYLWHWPIFVIAQYYGIQPNLYTISVFCILSIFIATFSFYYIESVKVKNDRHIISLMAMLFAVSCFGYFRINRFLYSEPAIRIASFSKNHVKEQDEQFSRNVCHVVDNVSEFDKNKCLCISENKKNILLIGDSHLAQLSQSLKERLGSRNINILQLTLSATLPTINKTRNREGELRELLKFIYSDFIPKNAQKIDGVVISAHWAASRNLDPAIILGGIREVISYLRKYNINTIVIGQTESYIMPYPTIAAKMYESKIDNRLDYIDGHNVQINKFLRDSLPSCYIDIINTDSFPNISSREEPYMFDSDHVTKYGSTLIVDKILLDPIAKGFFFGQQRVP